MNNIQMEVDDFPREAYLAVGDFNDQQIRMAQRQGHSPQKLLQFVKWATERKEFLKHRHFDGEPYEKRQKTEGGRKTRRARKNKKRQQKKSRRNYK
jgi:hypothetical protein